MVTRDRLDEAIDAAVRDLMAAEPPGGMRQRVLRGIAVGHARPGRFKLAAAVVALVLCVAAATLVWRRPAQEAAGANAGLGPVAGRLPEIASAQPARGSTSTPAGGPPPATLSASRAERGPAGVWRRDRASAPVVPPDTQAELTVDVAPLQPLAAIAVEPLSHDTLDFSNIAIAPIQVDPLRLSALDPAGSWSTPSSMPR